MTSLSQQAQHLGKLRDRREHAPAPDGAAPASGLEIWTPDCVAETTPTTSTVQRTISALVLAEDVATLFVQALTAPIEAGTAAERAEAREREITAIATNLSATDVLALDRRLRMDTATDPVAIAFRRLTVERRTRVLAALVERRKVLAGFSAIRR